jgi:predicted ATP-grasp superfamily ATP-dependent carboligase
MTMDRRHLRRLSWVLLGALLAGCRSVASFSPGSSTAPNALEAATASWPELTIAFDNDGDDDDDTPMIQRVLVLMDGTCPYHSGYMVARALDIPGVAVVRVLSDYLSGFLRQQGTVDDTTLDSMTCPCTPEEAALWKAKLGSPMVQIVGVYCESDSGLEQAERLRELLNVACRDEPSVLAARRHKHLMYEVAASAGLTVPTTKLCHSCPEAVKFAEQLLSEDDEDQQPYVIVKPFRGVASESVRLCSNKKDVEEAWTEITSSSVFGAVGKHSSVLVQEFVRGTEYACDIVSREGHHKVVAVWRYIKKPANGASFCYFKTELIDAAMDPNVEQVCEFAIQTLNALGVKWGISHNEVIVTNSGAPTLIEINHRQHNMDFCPLTMACIGYNAFDVALVAYLLTEDEWAEIPERPVLRAYGCMVHLVNYARGKLCSVNHLDVFDELDSVLAWEVYDDFKTIGSEIQPTVDIRTDAGWIQLISENGDDLARDYETIEGLMPTMFEAEP